ncbi:unnamed protein product [Protopolystoma xenopodis]|uniref:Uncharacterized protein n=1 Tax=Protopolystoma xenopodis TaxID=117903 RepID=A0A3S5C117_9PLAT|nr:unnamed protein product [Protopolystoma xenopodis]
MYQPRDSALEPSSGISGSVRVSGSSRHSAGPLLASGVAGSFTAGSSSVVAPVAGGNRAGSRRPTKHTMEGFAAPGAAASTIYNPASGSANPGPALGPGHAGLNSYPATQVSSGTAPFLVGQKPYHSGQATVVAAAAAPAAGGLSARAPVGRQSNGHLPGNHMALHNAYYSSGPPPPQVGPAGRAAGQAVGSPVRQSGLTTVTYSSQPGPGKSAGLDIFRPAPTPAPTPAPVSASTLALAPASASGPGLGPDGSDFGHHTTGLAHHLGQAGQGGQGVQPAFGRLGNKRELIPETNEDLAQHKMGSKTCCAIM